MDRTTLQTPRTGRSRFSKALPAPPPELKDDKPPTASREPLPSTYSPFPPRKDSVSARTNTSISQISPSIKSDLNSPLPSLPLSLPPTNTFTNTTTTTTNTMSATMLQTQTRTIPRKPVGLPANPAPVAGASAAKSKKMKRVSSISSLLSAYSHTSSDSVQRSSQGSIFTKDSEPSNSPEREGMNDTQPPLSKTLPVLPSNPYADELPSVTDEIIADLPPPPPLKDPTRPRTPSSARQVDSFPAPPRSGVQDGSPASATPKAVGDSPPRKEIWRRRASVKSDRSLLVPELKLADSHGSTASTTTSQPPAANSNSANTDLLPPPPLTQTSNTTSPLPPRSASLPGRNIRPVKPEPQQEDEMRKFSSKLKGLASRGDNAKEPAQATNSSDGSKDELTKSASKAQPEMNPVATIEDRPKVDRPINASRTPVETVGHAPAPSPAIASPEPPPKESAPKSISRRPVGSPVEGQTQKPEVHKKVSSSDLRVQNLGLPRHPRSARSNSSLRSPQTTHDVQEAVRPRERPQPQPIPTIEMISTMPADSVEPMKKPELFNVVTALNEPSISPNLATADRKPYRKVSADMHATNLSDIGESMENITPEQAEKVNEALSRFPRNISQTIPTDAVFQAAPITSQHHNCYVRHSKWVPVKNSNYPLACQTCGVQDTNSRKTCSWCNLRVCYGCHERLMGRYKGELRLLMQNMELDQLEEKRREKGKQTTAA